MIPAAKERLNLSKAEKWANERMPAMMPAKHAIPDKIMNARVAFQYAGDKNKEWSQNSSEDWYPLFLTLFVYFFLSFYIWGHINSLYQHKPLKI